MMVIRLFISLFILSSHLFSCSNSSVKDEKPQDNQKIAISEQLKGSIPSVQKRLNDINLEQRMVLSGKATMLIPEGFTLMNAEMLSLKYPSVGHRPTEVYTNADGTINIALNHTKNKASEENLPAVREAMEAQFNRPPIEFIQSGIREIDGQKCILMDFVSPASDGKIYNLMLMTSLEDRLAVVTFNCTEQHQKEWELRGKKILQSITIEK